ncbi:expressed unknown protein [Seminavis robusta]|uniref:Uncharacterized protein n=1 Tax=Seminavis robusta TaxID=568900 RepID=A0A9N8EYI2_9STRA|nr:expressed unknown protein [Seminavis robusta]|eukprot:Sro2126_g315720.1 n/a (651) ;mRNA; f:11840-13792
MTDKVCITLGSDSETKRALGRFRNLSFKLKNVDSSIEVKATRNFAASVFDWEDLMTSVAALPRLCTFRMKLLRSGAAVPSRFMEPLLENSRTLLLVSLVLVNVNWSGPTLGLKELASQLQALTSLRLVWCCTNSANQAGNDCLSHFLAGIAQIKTLKSVTCANCGFAREPLICQALVALMNNRSLENLTIKNCHNVTSNTLLSPLQELQENNNNTTKLKQLTLDPWGSFLDDCLVRIGEMLLVNQTLQDLSMDCGDASLMPIATALDTNRTLQNFCLFGMDRQFQPPDALVAHKFTHALKTNYVMRHVKVAGTEAYWSHDMDYYLRLNRAGRHLLFENETATAADWIQAFIDCSHDTPAVYELILRNPSALTSTVELPPASRQPDKDRSTPKHVDGEDDDNDSSGIPQQQKKRGKQQQVDRDLSSSEDASSCKEKSHLPKKKQRRRQSHSSSSSSGSESPMVRKPKKTKAKRRQRHPSSSSSSGSESPIVRKPKKSKASCSSSEDDSDDSSSQMRRRARQRGNANTKKGRTKYASMLDSDEEDDYDLKRQSRKKKRVTSTKSSSSSSSSEYEHIHSYKQQSRKVKNNKNKRGTHERSGNTKKKRGTLSKKSDVVEDKTGFQQWLEMEKKKKQGRGRGKCYKSEDSDDSSD